MRHSIDGAAPVVSRNSTVTYMERKFSDFHNCNNDDILEFVIINWTREVFLPLLMYPMLPMLL